jgi:NAD(P)-dependent dehydrogenase (short-subunit alcohol dehydrogenase family)
MKLRNRNAIITGGSQGLGRAIVETFVQEGAHVLFCARDGDSLARLEDELKRSARQGQRILSKVCDVSVPEEVEKLFRIADEKLGELQILVNNAGIYGPKGPSEEVPWEEWRRCIEINLYGTFLP